jgi:alpha-beta hydrolase superfamily lysophospholipase
MRGPVFKWIKIIIIVYCAIGIAFYYLQDQILFHPERKTINEAYNFDIPYKEVNIRYDTASNLNIVQFTTKDSVAKGVVLYFHGNKKNIGWYAKFAPNFTKNGYEVWMIDYPGFGKSTGKMTEQRLYDYALQLYKLARTKYGKDSIIIYGKSMGTGVAAQLASIRDCKRLILETPYSSMRGLVQTYFFMYPLKNMLHYNLPTYEYLQKVIDPVTIFHGTDDRLITYRNAAKLKAFLKPGDEFVTIKGAAHNNLNDYPLFHEKLDSLLKHN